MKRVFSADDRMLVGLMRSILEEHGIRCIIKNEHLAGAIGQLPPLECWPELWVVEDDDLLPARRLMDSHLQAGREPASPWRCPECGEALEGQFPVCWRCGHARDG